mgnify:CR=1 FL=1
MSHGNQVLANWEAIEILASSSTMGGLSLSFLLRRVSLSCGTIQSWDFRDILFQVSLIGLPFQKDEDENGGKQDENTTMKG